jgi:spermidine synthase
MAMGATTPLAMWALRALAPKESERSFSHLYMANLVGAVAGTLGSAFVLIEILGFRGTLHVAALLNALLAATALALSLRARPGPAAEAVVARSEPSPPPRLVLWALFATGCLSMAMEVVWIRQFTPYMGNLVYTFASILALYLLATFAGSRAYRLWAARRTSSAPAFVAGWVWCLIGVLGMLPLVAADPRLAYGPGHDIGRGLISVAFGIGPFCAALGFVTPLLVDRFSWGDPERGGGAYAINVVGCIVGPLLAGFGLLPLLGEQWSLFLLALPLLLLGLGSPSRAEGALTPRAAFALGAALTVGLALSTRTFETIFPGALVRRDATATVTARGENMQRQLLVNGVGMAYLTPITKLMAHLPLAHLSAPPARSLTICFGMGTSFRSSLSWGIRSVAVELVPSVPSLFGFFHADGQALLRSPNAHVVIDDGRRFLERSTETFDAIIIDPPPPVEAAGSSLLYSAEFYQTAERRLRPGGILQQWFPGGERLIQASLVRTFQASFPHTRFFVSVEHAGLHLLGSDRPIPHLAPEVLAARLPPAAARDLVEWGPARSPEEEFRLALRGEIPLEAAARWVPAAPRLTDDHPVNEYYFLRRSLGWTLPR